ncbi:hypothetical protein [Paraburkholderia bannensis]|uniref:hypothetical protein n=1 Tax=Paraburkholderia bannensis TaxID=765414 RepID=UPI002ABD6A1F|nr:hypothetical protein [Paraburkholderia bannensis]
MPQHWKDKAKAFASYFAFIEKAGTALIAQARRLQLLSNSGLCGVAGGALGVIAVTVFLHYNNYGAFEATLIGAVTPVLFAAVGLGVGRYIPARAGTARIEEENYVSQKLSEVDERIKGLSADLDALPVKKGTAARREVLTLQIKVSFERQAELQQQLRQLEGEYLGVGLVRTVEPAQKVLPELEPPAQAPDDEDAIELPPVTPAQRDDISEPQPEPLRPAPPERRPPPPPPAK